METFRKLESAEQVTWINPSSSMTEEAMGAIRKVIFENVSPQDDGMSGRGGVFREELQDGTKVVARPFLRGGLLRPWVKDLFFWIPGRPTDETRVGRELHITQLLWNKGLAVPRPLGGGIRWAWKGWAYRGFFVTQEVAYAENLLSLAADMDRRTEFLQACRLAGAEARKMLGVHVFHPDLHIGNVLVTPGPKVWLIDFDKAVQFPGDAAQQSYPGKLLQRWQRAVEKRGVVYDASIEFEHGLFDA